LDDGKNGYETYLEPDADDALIFRGESALFYGHGVNEKPYDHPLGSAQRETNLPGKPKTPQDVLAMMKTWRVYHFHDTSESARVKQTGDLNDNAVLRTDAENLAAFLYMPICRINVFRKNYDQIVDAARLVAPFFRNFSLRPDALNPSKIRLEWTERASDAYLNAHALSDGTLRFMCLATLLLQPKLPATILIDEPELGLHPSAIKTLTELFRLAASKTQLVASTQSVPLVNQLSPEEVIVVDRTDDRSEFRRLTPAEIAAWLDEYALGDLWEKNVLGGRP
jgi:predicted ATPase